MSDDVGIIAACAVSLLLGMFIMWYRYERKRPIPQIQIISVPVPSSSSCSQQSLRTSEQTDFYTVYGPFLSRLKDRIDAGMVTEYPNDDTSLPV